MSDHANTGGLDIRAASLRDLFRDWSARRGNRRFPARDDFDPLELRYILGNLSLVEVLRDPLRFVFRLHCSNSVEHLGVDLTGKEIAQMPAAAKPDQVRVQYELAVASRAPVVRRYQATFGDGVPWEFELLLLPLAGDGETIDMVMAGKAWTAR